MLDVADYERIRRRVRIEGKTQRQAADELGHSRNTISKALTHSSPPGYRRKNPPPRPALDPFLALIDAWVEADRSQPRKQRHTGTRIYERLRDEYGFTGSVSAVRRYLAQRKQTQGEVFFPLQFDAGQEGQVDWGQAWCLINGVERKVFLFCLRLCYSHVSYVRAYFQESQECFLDGHVHAFAFFGGVPRQLAYDNLKSAVITVGPGQDRRLNPHFVALRSHYLFETRFCNVASGNEKGHVENLVKHSQRTFMTPLPTVASLDAFEWPSRSAVPQRAGQKSASSRGGARSLAGGRAGPFSGITGHTLFGLPSAIDLCQQTIYRTFRYQRLFTTCALGASSRAGQRLCRSHRDLDSRAIRSDPSPVV